jgi:tetratricopeptide (TPR) repeat protein
VGLAVCVLVGWSIWPACGHVSARPSEAAADPNAACAPCHRAIYERYRATPMAQASGPASAGFISADFKHAASSVEYRIEEDQGRVWLSYHRTDPSRPLEGKQELRYFLGSGRRGRTYLFEQQGYWFEAPINWYAKKQLWDMTPHYLDSPTMPLTLPVDPGCLRCHASGAVSNLPDARNHFAGQPFAEGGITCTACHGDVRAHLTTGGKARLLSLAALEPVRRDSICLNCHLEGQAAVEHGEKPIEEFSPGDNLFDFIVFFVYQSENGSGGRATSQWEALLKSACKQKSGDRMTCTTCHDPHGSPPSDKRGAFYRERCMTCHNRPGFAESHHPENQDCTDCHMARPPSSDIAHEQVTDHWIRRRVNQERLLLAKTGELVTVGGVAASDRDFGLAYAQMAARGDAAAVPRAVDLLREAERNSNGASRDHMLHAQLGFLEQTTGQSEAAAAEYQRALEADSYDALAGGDLALIEARQKNYPEAARLWRAVFEHDPTQLQAGLNLAIVECGEGERDAVLAALDRILLFQPDDEQARAFAAKIRSNSSSCQRK